MIDCLFDGYMKQEYKFQCSLECRNLIRILCNVDDGILFFKWIFFVVVGAVLSKQSNVRVCESDMNWNSFEVTFKLGWLYDFFFALYIEHPLGRWLKAEYETKCISIIFNSRENWFVFGSYALDYMRKATSRPPKHYA